MVLKADLSILTFSFIFIVLIISIPAGPAQALPMDIARLPALEAFISQVTNGEPEELRGVYVPQVMAARVVQQPEDDMNFVSSGSKVVTQFALASRLGSTGLLAHNYLAGQSFSLLEEGQEFYLVYGDGQTTTFTVTENLHYRALEPTSTLSSFVSLDNGTLQTASEVFAEVYNRPGQVIFQTCIAANGNPSWGRLFIIAESDYTPEYSFALKPKHFHRYRRK